jgi:hypothetical protein
MIVSQFRTFQDIFGKEPILVSIPTHSVSTENPKTGKTVTIIPIPNKPEAIISAMQSGQVVQQPQIVSMANQSLFSQLIQKLTLTNETIPEAKAEVQPKNGNFLNIIKKNWILVVVAFLVIIGVIILI